LFADSGYGVYLIAMKGITGSENLHAEIKEMLLKLNVPVGPLLGTAREFMCDIHKRA
jgi:hypothetical protein